MKNAHLQILIAIIFASLAYCDEGTDKNQIVQMFYQTLVQSEAPSAKKEVEIFGPDSDVSGLLKARGSTSDTPIWDCLRAHKEWFLPQGENPLAGVQISSEFQMFSIKFNRYREEKRVLVYFPIKSPEPSAKHESRGLECVLFYIEKDGKLDIGGTFFPGKGMLFGRVYSSESPVSANRFPPGSEGAVR